MHLTIKMHACIHQHACMHQSICMHESINIHTYINQHICISQHACMHQSTCMHVSINMYACINQHVVILLVCKYNYCSNCIVALRLCGRLGEKSMIIMVGHIFFLNEFSTDIFSPFQFIDCWPDMPDLPLPGEFGRHTLQQHKRKAKRSVLSQQMSTRLF